MIMAQVIKHGKFYREPKKEIPLDKRKYTLVCKKCKCEFSFRGSEANLIEIAPSTKDFNEFRCICGIDCPECETKNGFEIDESPFEEVEEEES